MRCIIIVYIIIRGEENYAETRRKKWISYKENAIEQAGLEYEGGTMRPMVENQTGADLTKQRVYELSQYLK